MLTGTRLAAGLSLLLLAMPVAASETTEPVQGAVAESGEPLDAQAPAPRLKADAPRMNAGPLVPRTIPYHPLHHRGGVYVDAGEGTVAVPNEVEAAKLDRARELVAVARAAGTLWILPDVEALEDVTPEDISELKLERLRAQQPQVFEHPLAGVGQSGDAFVPVPTPDDAPGDRPTPQPETAPAETPAPPTEGVSHD